MSLRFFLTLCLLLNILNCEILKARSLTIETKIPKKANEEEEEIEHEENSKVEEHETKEAEKVAEDKKKKELELQIPKKQEEIEISVEETPLIQPDMCIAKVTRMFIPILQEGEYKPYEAHPKVSTACPGLTQNCCGPEALLSQLDKFKSTYEQFKYYADITSSLSSIQMAELENEPSEDLMKELETKKQEGVEVSEAAIAAAFKQSISKSSIYKMIDEMSIHFSGFICQACDPKSHKYFTFNKDEKVGGTLKIKILNYKKLYELLSLEIELEAETAIWYRIMQHSKEFTKNPSGQMKFKTDAAYQNIISDLKECASKSNDPVAIANLPKCVAFSEKVVYTSKLVGLQWLKQAYQEIVHFMESRCKGLEDSKQFLEKLQDEIDYVPGNEASTDSIHQFETVYDTKEGFSMDEYYLNKNVWQWNFEKIVRVFFGMLLFVLVK